MARDIDRIQAVIIQDIKSYPELATLTANDSKRAIWRLWSRIGATNTLVIEQLIDQHKAEIEAIASRANGATANFLVDKVFKFQYSATNPQIAQLDTTTFAVDYPVIDSTLRIITRCAVSSTLSNQVIIKVAKSDPPTALSTLELSSLQSYVNSLGVAGINYFCYSTNSDKVHIDAEIYYSGQYASVIQTDVINSINTFLAKIPFDGKLLISDLEIAIKNTIGVKDVIFKNIKLRSDNDTFLNGVFLVQNKTLISRLMPLNSGYVIGENTTGYTFNDSLTFIAQ